MKENGAKSELLPGGLTVNVKHSTPSREVNARAHSWQRWRALPVAIKAGSGDSGVMRIKGRVLQTKK